MRAFFVRWKSFIQRLAAYGGVMSLLQLVNALSGFVLVRSMDKEHYAWFTIVNSVFAMISVMTDSGLGSAVMSLGGEHFNDRARFASLMLTANRLRFRFAVIAMSVVIPAGWWMLWRNGAPVWMTAGLLGLVACSAIFAAEAGVLGAVNRLERRVDCILRSDACLSLSRLGAVLLGWLAGLNSLLATAATAVSQWAQLRLLRRQTSASLAIGEVSDEEWRPCMMKVVWQVFPLSLFQALQGQLTTWVLGIFAVTTSVADLGALSRLAIAFTLLGLPMIQLVCPVISRTSDPVRLKKLCWSALGGFALATVIVAVMGVVFSEQVLWVLGHGYGHLRTELAWYLGAQALAVITTAIWGVVFTRSWVRNGWWQVPITLLLQVVVATQLNLQDVRHAIIFGSVLQLVGGVTGLILIVRGLREHAAISSAFKPGQT